MGGRKSRRYRSCEIGSPTVTVKCLLQMVAISRCALCLRDEQLQMSHLIPRALYLDRRMPELPNPNPIYGLPEEQGPRQEQFVERLLCRDCEHRFSVNGEKWVLENGYRLKGPSTIYEALAAATAVPDYPGGTVYAGAEIDALDMDKLSYFGASVFWRASVVHLDIGRKRRHMIQLGAKYEESLRAYLLGEAPFPNSMVLWSAVCRTPEPPPVITYPAGERVSEGYESFYRHTFDIPGLSYMLHVGNRLPPHIRDTCVVASPRRYIYFSPFERLIDRNTARAFAKSAPSQSLRKLHRKVSGEEL